MRDADDLRRRVKAARALAGFTVTDLAKALPADAKLGARTLRTLEGDSAPRSFRRHELDLIAKAAGISTAFFDVDFSALSTETPAEGGLDAHRDEMGRNVTQRLLDIEEVIRSVEPRLALLEADRRKQREGQAPADIPGRAVQGQTRRRRADG